MRGKTLAIHSRRMILPDGVQDATVLIKNGKVVLVTEGHAHYPDIESIDVKYDVVMPGLVDPHVHINEPGRTDWEGFDTATKAALASGVTTLVDMPLNSNPVTTTTAAFFDKQNAARKYLHANCGFWGGVIPGNVSEIEPLIDAGVLGFKAFLVDSGIPEFPAMTEDDLRKVMPMIARHGLPLLVHCELAGDAPAWNDVRSYQQYLTSRPRKWENDAIALMIRLCAEFNCRTHIVHVSSSEALPLIAQAKSDKLPLTAETGQHYLFFAAEEIEDGRTECKCAPPIREKENRELLWNALYKGTLDFVATDHSPAPPSLKEMESGDFHRAWGGIASLQFALPAFWTAAKDRGYTIQETCKWLCTAPASFIPRPEKGKIAVGCDADLVVWNPEEMFTVQAEDILHRHKVTPYLNRELSGVVRQTYLSGELVFDRGKFPELNKGEILLRNGQVLDT